MLALTFVGCLFLLVSSNRLEKGGFFMKTSGGSNSAEENHQQNFLNEDFFSCNLEDGCSTVSKTNTKATEIWSKVKGTVTRDFALIIRKLTV